MTTALAQTAHRMGVVLYAVPDITPDHTPAVPVTHRPQPGTILEMIGQEQIRTRLLTRLKSAEARNVAPEHVMLSGPGGLGKSSLARMVSAFTGGTYVETDALALSTPAMLWAELEKLGPYGVLFIDEGQELDKKVAAALLVPMRDGVMHVTVGTGKSKRVATVPLEPFTVVMATTEAGALPGPLQDRFGFRAVLDYYSDDELRRIVTQVAGKLDPPVTITEAAAADLGSRGRGTPNTALDLLRSVRDYGTAMSDDPSAMLDINVALVDASLSLDGIDLLGLTPQDRKVLFTLCTVFAGGPTGIGPLVSATNVKRKTIENDIEPILQRAGMLRLTDRGRVATPAAYEHLGSVPEYAHLQLKCPLGLRLR